MTVDLALQLRSLTQDYHEGRLNLTAYRQMRAALLDSLVANVATAAAAAAVAVTQPRGGTWRQADAITRPGKPRTASGESPTLESRDTSLDSGNPPSAARGGEPGVPAGERGGQEGVPGSRAVAPELRALPVRAIAIVVVVLALAGVGFWLWHGRATSSADASGAAPSAAEQDRVRGLLSDFTERGDWGDAHLAALNTDLLELGGARIAEEASEPGFLRFVEEVRQRLKEQQALASTPLSANNSPLAALAVTVGLDLDAPDAAIHIVAPPPQRVPENPTPPPRKTSSTSSAAQPASVSHATYGADLSAARLATDSDAGAGAGADDSARAGANAGQSTRDGTGVASSAGANAHGAANVGDGANAGARVGTASATIAQIEVHEGACRVELVGSRRPLCHDLLPAGADGPALALVPAGAFEMGSTAAAEEQPVHRVTIREPFAISVYEVSQGEFKQFCEHAGRSCPPQPWAGDDYPVVNVSWDDARAYTGWLSSVTHHHYALPTEAQWEYAARAGRTGLFPSGDALSPTDAQYSMLAKQTAAARRSQKFNANAFRLMHTVGNVREWVEDAWAQSFAGAPSDGSAIAASQPAQRVARGGSYTDGAARLRLSMREGLPAGTRDATTGFRIVRELP